MTLSHHQQQQHGQQEQGTSSNPSLAFQESPAFVQTSSSAALLAGIAQPCSTPDVKGKKRESSLDWLPPASTSGSTEDQQAAEAAGSMQSFIHAAQQQSQGQPMASWYQDHIQQQQQEALTAAAEAAAMQQAFAAASSASATTTTSSSSTAQIQAGASSIPAELAAPIGSLHLPTQSTFINGKGSSSSGVANAASFATASVPAALAGLLLPPEVVSTNPTASSSTPLVPPPTRKLCVRHQRMADEGTTAKLQASIESLPLADQRAVNSVWSIFSSSSHARRALILQGILTMCCFSQLSLLSSELALAIRIDPFSLFPREVSLKVLGYTDAITLGRAAQVSKSWKELADDDLLWRNMCEQHIERKCEKCGWGLPLLNDKKRRRAAAAAAVAPAPVAVAAASGSGSGGAIEAAAAQGVDFVSTEHSAAPTSTPAAASAPSPSSNGNLKRSITAAANAAALEKRNYSRPPSPTSLQQQQQQPPAKRQCTGNGTMSSSSSQQQQQQEAATSASASGLVPVAGAAQPQQVMTRPWKSVYCERLMIERNWRSGRYSVRTLKGHTDGIMCLQFSENLAHPSFPVLITGSYDRTARIWNLETGKELRVLRGHTRGVRCLQFDEMKLITGSMDRTLKIWNWRTGELIRTLEGHTAGIVCLHFNDEILASGSQDSNIKVWNFRSGECFTLKGHEDWINAVQLWSAPKQPHQQEPPATFLFSASDDCTIRLWDLQTRECLMTYEGHVGQVQSIKLVMLDDDAVLKLTKSAAGGAGKGRNPAAQGGNPSGSGDNDGAAARRRHLDRTYEEDVIDEGNDAAVAAASASAASAQCGYNPSNVPGDGRLANTNAPDLPERFFTTTIAGPSSRTAAGDKDQGMRFVADERFNSPAPMQPNGIPPRLLRLQERLSEAGLVPPIPYDAEIGDIDGGFSALQAEREEQTNAARSSRGGLKGSDAGTSTNGKRSKSKSPTRRPCSKARPVLLSGSLDNTLKVFDVRTGRCIRTLFGHVEGVWSVDVDKLRIVSASHDRTIKIWDRDTAHCQTTLVGHRAAVTFVALGDDKIVSGSDDSEIKIWSFTSD